MKQVFQDVSKGHTDVQSVPRPACQRGQVLIATRRTLISAGTERMLVDFGRANLLEKARQQPDKVKMVLDKVRTDGLLSTLESVKARLDQPIAMGYSNVGTVVETGTGVRGFKPGDRVLSNGQHAEFVCVGQNLCAAVPAGVSDDDAVFGVVGAIALQGVRLADPSAGEAFVVQGLGLIGLLTVQILKACGCRVLGIDVDEGKLAIAASFGADVTNAGDDPVAAALQFSRGHGVDGVLITASAESNELVHQAATMSRRRGRIVLVGVVGLDLQRADFYEKELTFQVSCSYGPGRYDPLYEEQGQDYPFDFVRWTEQRNFEAVLDLIADGRIDTSPLRSAEFDIDQAARAYDLLVQDRSVLGVTLRYSDDTADGSATMIVADRSEAAPAPGVIGAIGAGNYASRVLLPAFAQTGAALHSIVSANGVSGTAVARKLGFGASSTDAATVLNNDDIDTVVIATRHDTHAAFTIDALQAGKHVFVEKPLALTRDELGDIESAYASAQEGDRRPLLMVGFNRRFAPMAIKLKAAVDNSAAPMSVVYTCNAGAVDARSWIQDPQVGGGRIIGEACHFIDFARFLAGAPIIDVRALAMDSGDSAACADTATITLRFGNGSLATIQYFANGHRSFPKERIEVFQDGRVMVLDNFRQLRGYGSGRSGRAWRQDKGQTECCRRFIEAVRSGKPAPIAGDELMEVSRVSIEAAEMLRNST